MKWGRLLHRLEIWQTLCCLQKSYPFRPWSTCLCFFQAPGRIAVDYLWSSWASPWRWFCLLNPISFLSCNFLYSSFRSTGICSGERKRISMHSEQCREEDKTDPTVPVPPSNPSLLVVLPIHFHLSVLYLLSVLCLLALPSNPWCDWDKLITAFAFEAPFMSSLSELCKSIVGWLKKKHLPCLAGILLSTNFCPRGGFFTVNGEQDRMSNDLSRLNSGKACWSKSNWWSIHPTRSRRVDGCTGLGRRFFSELFCTNPFPYLRIPPRR